MKLAIKITGQPGIAFKAWCPALPGCVVFASSRDEAQARMRTAMEGYLASLDVALPRELGRMLQTEAAYEVA